MDENIKSIVTEMKALVHDIYRYASALDEAVMSVETNVTGNNIVFDKAFIATTRAYHEQVTQVRFGNLKEREDELWSKLI